MIDSIVFYLSEPVRCARAWYVLGVLSVILTFLYLIARVAVIVFE